MSQAAEERHMSDLPLQLVDTHCHLCDRAFDGDREELLQELFAATDAGGDAAAGELLFVVEAGVDEESSAAAADLSGKWPGRVYHAAGVHPHEASSCDASRLARLVEEWRTRPGFVALGETGLDYHYEYSPRKRQLELFEAHVELAVEYDLPLVIHVREAFDDCISVLSNVAGESSFVIHGFTGDVRQAERFLEAGGMLAFNGILTFRNADSLRRAAAAVPLDRILVETDCPYLAPVPLRGRRNRPDYVVHVVNVLAGLHGVSPGEAAAVTAGNAGRFFRLRDAGVFSGGTISKERMRRTR